VMNVTDFELSENISQEKKYTLVVSFYSKGQGSDYKALEDFRAFIQSFEKKHKLKLKVTEARWGREGELDFCFDMNGISSSKKAKFVDGTKKVLEKSSLVHIHENVSCINLRE
jgi:hypothetical protein